MEWKSPDCCELCLKKLNGTAEISSSISGEMSILIVKESLKIDWSFCRICQSVVCQESCVDKQTGYCKACSRGMEVKDFGESNPINSPMASIRQTGFQNQVPNPDDEVLSADVVF